MTHAASMKFIKTKLHTGTDISVNIAHVENIYRYEPTGAAVIVMLPIGGDQRTFETVESYFDMIARIGVDS